MKHFQKLYKALKLMYYLITAYGQNYFYHWNDQHHLIKFSFSFRIPHFGLLSYELDNFTFKVLH